MNQPTYGLLVGEFAKAPAPAPHTASTVAQKTSWLAALFKRVTAA